MIYHHRRKPRPCLHCGVTFTPEHGNAQTCSFECKRERNLKRTREYHREARDSDPAKFMENRDPAAVAERRRERYRRGQAARRARLKAESDATPNA